MKVGTLFNRLIYSFEFPDKSVYVGLTFNPKKRFYRHYNDSRSSVYKHILKTSLKPTFKILTNFLDKNVAIFKEEEYLRQYILNGWKILNKKKTGGLGGTYIIWKRDNCIVEALKYTTKTEWAKKSSRSYFIAKQNDWFTECVKHMKRPVIHNKKWTLDECKKEALKFNIRKDWYLLSRSSYVTAVRNHWIKLCDGHLC